MKTAAPAEFLDSGGQTIRLGKLIGKGGEGSVFAVEAEPSLAAKVYHQTPLSQDNLDKLEAMVSRRSMELDTISAWPHSVLYDARRKGACGILIPKIVEARHLHELYGTSNRRRHFPDAQWHHLVLAARNVAAAFETLHSAGIIVGDVNQGNLLVNQQMCVRFIDCDSFQLASNGQTFLCPVGTPHFTPPELQLKKLRDTPRTVDHDRFGLAVLLFHLLFVGRHPFAGRFHGAGELNIEKAIAERRFAFSKDKAATLVEPPPASLLLDDVPAAIGALFERAFRGQGDANERRPTAEQWVHELEALLRQRRNCSYDAAHVFYSELKECPWCRIEDEGGPAFFVLGGAVSTSPYERLDHLEDKLRRLTVPSFPNLAPQRLLVPQAVRPKRTGERARITKANLGAALLAVSIVLCFSAAASIWMLAGGTLAAILGAGLLLFSKAGKFNRSRLVELGKRLTQMQNSLQTRAGAISANHRRRQAAFDGSVAELKAECDNYCAADTQLQDVLVLHRASEMNRFLSRHLLQEHVARIPGLTFSMASVLQSYGIESAADVESLKLIGVPMLTPGLTMELTNWREGLEHEFEFKPEHGVTFNYVSMARDVAVKRFKIFQARRILMAAKQLDSLAAAAREQLARELNQYDQSAAKARDVVFEIRDFQGSRLGMERLFNSSRTAILATALGVPIAGSLVYLLFG